MKLKTSELAGAALDWAVAAALNAQFQEDRVIKVCRHEATTPAWIERENAPGSAPHYHRYSPSTGWAQGGPIIDLEGIGFFQKKDEGYCQAAMPGAEFIQWGPTPLMAAMRCYVASKLGYDVDVPEELLA